MKIQNLIVVGVVLVMSASWGTALAKNKPSGIVCPCFISVGEQLSNTECVEYVRVDLKNPSGATIGYSGVEAMFGGVGADCWLFQISPDINACLVGDEGEVFDYFPYPTPGDDRVHGRLICGPMVADIVRDMPDENYAACESLLLELISVLHQMPACP